METTDERDTADFGEMRDAIRDGRMPTGEGWLSREDQQRLAEIEDRVFGDLRDPRDLTPTDNRRDDPAPNREIKPQ